MEWMFTLKLRSNEISIGPNGVLIHLDYMTVTIRIFLFIYWRHEYQILFTSKTVMSYLLGAFLTRAFIYLNKILGWLKYFVHSFPTDAILTFSNYNIHQCPYFNTGIAKSPLKWGQRYMQSIMSHMQYWMWLLNHVIISNNMCFIPDVSY